MATIESSRAVLDPDETYDGSIVPSSQAELSRDITLQEGSTVVGSLYGETIELEPDTTVSGSVMAKSTVDFQGGRIEGEVGTPGKVTGIGGQTMGSVTGQRVTLEDTVVRGNVVGTEVILENCTVLGLVAADRALILDGTLCYTFHSHGETTLSDTTVVLPQAIADGDLSLSDPVTVAGLGDVEGAFDQDDDASQRPQMTEADLHEREGTTYLTLAPRMLNTEAITDRLDELERDILGVVTDAEQGRETTVEEVYDRLDVSLPTSG